MYKNSKLLIIESEHLQQQALKSIISRGLPDLEIVGFAKDGQEAVEKFKELRPNIVITGIRVAKLNGLELTRILRRLDPKLSIIILTAYAKFSYVQAALKLDVDDYLLKPASPKAIVEALEKLVYKQNFGMEDRTGDFHYGELRNKYLNGDLIAFKSIIYRLLGGAKEFEDVERVKREIYATVKLMMDNYNFSDDIEILGLYKELRSSVGISDLLANLNSFNKKNFLDSLPKITVNKDELEISLQYIELHLSDKLRLSNVAEFVHISPTYFSKQFKDKLGMNFIEHLSKRRIETAKLLLRYTSLSILEVSQTVGYNESNYFSRVFKEATKTSPRDYRNSYNNDEEELYFERISHN